MSRLKKTAHPGPVSEDRETIAAVSSAPGIGAVAVLRISGARAWDLTQKLAADPERFQALKVRTSSLFRLVDPSSGEELDRAIVVKYKSPESFTGEDLVEIHCHGGIAVPHAILSSVIAAGARAARAGEFTRRAFLNGKFDLAQAEAIDDLVQARSETGRQIALAGLSGELGQRVLELRENLLDLKAELEYDIDFPDEPPLENLASRVEKSIAGASSSIEDLLEGAGRNILLCRGALTVIAGEPNVGKSTLFNRLVGCERSIVTEEPGTTRDAVEMEAMIDGILFRLVDTAGLRRGARGVEKIGVEFSRKYIDRADLVLFVHDACTGIDRAEKAFLSARSGAVLLRVVNKVDKLGEDEPLPKDYLPVSALEGTGIDLLRQSMTAAVLGPERGASPGPGGSPITRVRQKSLLEEALRGLRRIEPSASPEYLAADLDEVSATLAEITGGITDEEVLERIFSRFCIGK